MFLTSTHRQMFRFFLVVTGSPPHISSILLLLFIIYLFIIICMYVCMHVLACLRYHIPSQQQHSWFTPFAQGCCSLHTVPSIPT